MALSNGGWPRPTALALGIHRRRRLWLEVALEADVVMAAEASRLGASAEISSVTPER